MSDRAKRAAEKIYQMYCHSSYFNSISPEYTEYMLQGWAEIIDGEFEPIVEAIKLAEEVSRVRAEQVELALMTATPTFILQNHTHAKFGEPQEFTWSECVTPGVFPKCELAHGGIVKIETCFCGAWRKGELCSRPTEHYLTRALHQSWTDWQLPANKEGK